MNIHNICFHGEIEKSQCFFGYIFISGILLISYHFLIKFLYVYSPQTLKDPNKKYSILVFTTFLQKQVRKCMFLQIEFSD